MRIEELSPRLAALADAIDARFAGRVERLPAALNAGQLAYEVDAAALIDVCRTLRGLREDGIVTFHKGRLRIQSVDRLTIVAGAMPEDVR